MWAVTLLTAVGMAFVNFFSLLVIESCLKWKFKVMQNMIDRGGLVLGVVVLTLISMVFSLMGVVLILWYAPNCGGSGLPESKCYLNGGVVRSFFTVRNLIVRILTSILANTAGFPVGREGPTVTIGGNLAYLISYKFTLPYVKQWVDLSANTSTLIVEEDRFAHATRINCAVGGACAMAMLFNTPIGGLLYMFEEISPSSWPIELTFRAFVATTVCALFSYGLLDTVNKEIREFVIFAWLPQDKTWSAGDLPIFVAISAILGAVCAYHTRMMLEMARLRKIMHGKLKYQRLGVAIETVIYCAVCSFVACAASMMSTCRDEGTSNLQYVRFNCPEGQYNPVASLLVNTSHSSVKLLFSGNNEGEILYRSTALAFLAYFVLNVGLAGLPVPGGAFTATMLLGGLFGRSCGALLRELGWDLAVSGVYAVVGAAAMLCGFKQMAAAVVLIVVQCVNDFSITPVVMLSVSVALAVNRAINERGHDEEQIERKNLPFLEPEVPSSLDNSLAVHLMDPLPPSAELPRSASMAKLKEALQATEDSPWSDFPVLDGRNCIGIITRAHLSATLKAATTSRVSSTEDLTALTPSNGNGEKVRRSDQMVMVRVASGLTGSGLGQQPGEGKLPLDRIMDPTPFTIVEDMPAPRFYSLFAKAGERAACVVNKSGEYLGIISRTGLISAARRLAPH